MSRFACSMLAILILLFVAQAEAAEPEVLSGTKKLELQGDIAATMVEGIDRFLLRELAGAPTKREKLWKHDFTSTEAYLKSIEPQRKKLAHILGVRDKRREFESPELIATTSQSSLIAKGKDFEVFAVRWPVVRDIQAEGLLLVPTGVPKVADVIAIPSAEQTPEQLCGLVEGIAAESQYPRFLAQSGCRVLIPTTIRRRMQKRSFGGGDRGPNLTDREFVYRPAFEMGRHILGYEVQQVLAGVDWFSREAGKDDPKIGVIGYGDGGQLAMYAGALDQRIDATCVSGYFGPREDVWKEPLDRNVQGLVETFGDAEVASLILPRSLVIDSTPGPNMKLPSEGGGPADYPFPAETAIATETRRLLAIANQMPSDPSRKSSATLTIVRESPAVEFCNQDVRQAFLQKLLPKDPQISTAADVPTKTGNLPDSAARQARLVKQLIDDTQTLLADSTHVRADFMRPLYASKNIDEYKVNVEKYREQFATEIIGRFDHKLLPAEPKSRKTYENEKWTGYEVMLDVFPDVFAYGVLLIPKDRKQGEKRPVVVCQHGLEGRPTDVLQGDHYAYHDFAAKLCEQGFITFSPQNIYIGKDKFRTLQRKLNPLGKTLFSIMVPQHQQICNWLKELPMVDKDRIAFYGLSYGGKSAMRIPPLVPDYCLSICSADFNEWVSKNASTRLPFSYIWTGEYEIFEFDLGPTFNYSEMAALICPRPFMVERGHTDGVSTDEWVAHEYAKVFYNYSHRLKIGDRCELEVFDGPHTINGKGTYAFLRKHLNWQGK
jgi:dienelactone hydrolase